MSLSARPAPRALLELLGAALGVLFVFGGVAKLAHAERTALVLRPVWPWLSAGIMGAVSLLELALGLTLLLAVFRAGVLLVTGGVLIAFTELLLYGKAHGLAECGCFGGVVRSTVESSLSRNALFLCLTSAALALEWRGRAPTPSETHLETPRISRHGHLLSRHRGRLDERLGDPFDNRGQPAELLLLQVLSSLGIGLSGRYQPRDNGLRPPAPLLLPRELHHGQVDVGHVLRRGDLCL
ncbi:MAG TPA: MauE/DoxX family redox-associated membrane protein [Phycisphaerales bacterium]|nr:MauE/DoxX family redox-associated membrane protein [Phycisphaerales bacterium]